jgi:HicB family
MSVLTIRIPESKHERLKHLAKARGLSLNKLMEELSTIALAQHDAEVRFRAMAARGSRKKGLALLDKLDRAFSYRRAERS